MARRSICDTTPTQKFRSACERVVHKLRKNGASILEWGCSQGFLGDDFYIVVPYRKRPDVSDCLINPTVYIDRNSTADTLRELTGYAWDEITCEGMGFPCFDFDREDGFLIVPKTDKSFKKGFRRVMLENPVPIDDFVNNVKRIVTKNDIDPSKYHLRTVFCEKDDSLFEGMICRSKD